MSKLQKLHVPEGDKPQASAAMRGCLFAAIAIIAVATGQSAQADAGLIVKTREGPVEGVIRSGVAEFLGIPYAAPPVGPLRWRPPVSHAAWTKPRMATTYAPACAQAKTLGVFAGPVNDNEDCLTLNVFTPATKPAAVEKLPVIVWIHGGGNFDGSAVGYDGGKLATMGHVVVVTIQYRLNLMGFLAHPALDHEGHPFGNYGLLDQEFALQWVHDNIAGFGGDPKNITAGGQSAGAYDTELAMVSPRLNGAFRRAICQSGCSTDLVLPSLESAEATGVAFAKAAGCGTGTGPDVANCLRALPAAKIEELAAGPASALAGSRFVIGPMVDGTIIPLEPVQAFISGRFAHVPIMNGSVADEENFFLAVMRYATSPDAPLTAAQYEGYVSAAYAPPAYPKGAAKQILERYSPDAYPTVQQAWNRAGSDQIICGVRRFSRIVAAQTPVYAYEFDERTAPSYFPAMRDFVPGAFHTSDIQYVFPLWHGGPQGTPHPLDNAQTALSDRLVAAWSNFARTGNPNGDGNETWPRFTDEHGAEWFIERIGAPERLPDRQYSTHRNCDFWDGLHTKSQH